MNREIMQQVLCIIKLLRTHDNEQATEKLELISAFEKELAKREQAKYSDIVSDGGLDPRDKFDAQPEQDWSLLRATQESLREHQARIKELEAQLAPQVCCGDYEKCWKPCTPRGRWLANQQMTWLGQEKEQFVGGMPDVSQQREWVGLTEHDIERTFISSGYTAKNFARAIETKLKELNT
jgi:hypothetical protein